MQKRRFDFVKLFSPFVFVSAEKTNFAKLVERSCCGKNPRLSGKPNRSRNPPLCVRQSRRGDTAFWRKNSQSLFCCCFFSRHCSCYVFCSLCFLLSFIHPVFARQSLGRWFWKGCNHLFPWNITVRDTKNESEWLQRHRVVFLFDLNVHKERMGKWDWVQLQWAHYSEERQYVFLFMTKWNIPKSKFV